MITTIVDCVLMLGVVFFALCQAQLESKRAPNFCKEMIAWSLAFFLCVVMGFKVFDRFYTDPASVLDLFKHLAFLLLAGKYYILTKKCLTIIEGAVTVPHVESSQSSG